MFVYLYLLCCFRIRIYTVDVLVYVCMYGWIINQPLISLDDSTIAVHIRQTNDETIDKSTDFLTPPRNETHGISRINEIFRSLVHTEFTSFSFTLGLFTHAQHLNFSSGYYDFSTKHNLFFKADLFQAQQ